MTRTDPLSVAAPAGGATEFAHEEHLSRRQTAERLVDLAYALTAGAGLELRGDGERVDVPVPEVIVLQRMSTADGERVDVHIQLSWSGDRRGGGAPRRP